MYVIHSPESGTPSAPLRPKSSTPRSGFVQPGEYSGRRDSISVKCWTSLARRLTKGLGFLMSYSFQKTLTNTDGAMLYGYYIGYTQDVYNRKLEKSVAGFDHTQNLRLTS